MHLKVQDGLAHDNHLCTSRIGTSSPALCTWGVSNYLVKYCPPFEPLHPYRGCVDTGIYPCRRHGRASRWYAYLCGGGPAPPALPTGDGAARDFRRRGTSSPPPSDGVCYIPRKRSLVRASVPTTLRRRAPAVTAHTRTHRRSRTPPQVQGGIQIVIAAVSLRPAPADRFRRLARSETALQSRLRPR